MKSAKTVIGLIDALEHVEKVFWSCRDAGAASECYPSMTNEDGSETEVPKGLGGACGFNRY